MSMRTGFDLTATSSNNVVSFTPNLQGEYRDLGSSTDNETPNLADSKASYEEQQPEAERVRNNPGNYDPDKLILAGRFYIITQDLDDAATLVAGAIHRTTIDAKLCGDPSCADRPKMYYLGMGHLVETACDKRMRRVWAEKLQVALKGFEAWDRQTPYNYDTRWILKYGLGAFLSDTLPAQQPADERTKFIESYYRHLSGKLLPEDITASPDDECFLDDNRLFTHKPSGLTFTVPENIKVPIGIDGKYYLNFLPESKFSLMIGYGRSYQEPQDLDWKFNYDSKYFDGRDMSDDSDDEDFVRLPPKGTTLWCIVGENIRAYTYRCIEQYGEDEPYVSMTLNFLNGNDYIHIYFVLNYAEEDEELVLEEVRPIWESIRRIDPVLEIDGPDPTPELLRPF